MFCMLLSIPGKTGYLKHLYMFFGRTSVTCMDADLSKHKSWSRAQQHHTQEMDKLTRGMLRPHSCRLSYQAHMGTSAQTKFPSMQTLLCCIRPLHRAVHICSKRVYSLVLSFRSVCINGGLNLCCYVFSLM